MKTKNDACCFGREIGIKFPLIPPCPLAQRVVNFFLLSFFVGSVSFAADTEWHGFVDSRVGVRTQNDPHEDDRNLSEIRAQVDALTYFEQASLQIRADFLYDDLADEIEKVDLENGDGFMDLREFNLQFSPLDWADMKIGRQILTWGTGDLLFINDLFPKDWNSFLLGRDEEYLKAPSDAVYASFFPSFGNIDLVLTPRMDADRYIDGRRVSFWNPGLQRIAGQDAMTDADRRDDWGEDAEVAMRFYRNIKGYEAALYAYRGFWKSPQGFDPSTGNAYFPKLSEYGASVRGTFKGGIANLEAGYYDSREDRSGTDPNVPNSEVRFLTGYQREVARDLTASVQYYVEWMQDYDDYLSGIPSGTARDEARHVVTLRLTKMLMNQNLILGLFTFYSPSDRDAYFRPNATYKLSDSWTVSASGNIFVGEDDHTFFGQFKDNSNVGLSVRYSW